MAYIPTTWVEKVTKVGPTNLNHMEKGIASAAAGIFNVSDYLAVGDGVTDDWAAISAAVTAVPAAGGEVVLTGNHLITKTILVQKSGVRIRFAPGASLKLAPVGAIVPGVNDSAIFIAGGGSAMRPITGAVAIGATSFVATNAGDVTDLVAGDWVNVMEFDAGVNDYVLVDWVQVRTVAGTTVNTQAPFRTAFPATGGGRTLRFQRISTLVEDCQVYGARVNIPAYTGPLVGIYTTLARKTLLYDCQVNDAWGDAFASFRTNHLTLTDCYQAADLTQSSEFAQTVGLIINGTTLETVGSVTTAQAQANTTAITLDFGTCFFSITGNRIGATGSIAVLLQAVHDGVFSGNVIDWVRSTGTDTTGILAQGCQRVQCDGNVFVGGDGANAQGISFGDTSGWSVNIHSQDNTVGPNTIHNFAFPITMNSVDDHLIVAPAAFALTDGASVDVDAGRGTFAMLSTVGSRTMTATRGRTLGAEITVEILNNTAGAITTAWTAGDFNLAGAWVDPGAFGLRRSITFIGQATKWTEKCRTTADY